MTTRARTILVAAVIAVVVIALVVAAMLLSRRPKPLPPVDSATLREAVTTDGLMAHLAALQQVADAHGGHRQAGTPGHEASVDYVERQLQAAGYRTQRQAFTFERVDLARTVLEQDGRAYAAGTDHQALMGSGTGRVSAPVTPVDLNLTGDHASSSGCEESDFDGFPAGDIALVQRGECQFGVKVAHATEAGASAVVVLNQGDGDRTGLFQGTLGDEPVTVPVLAITYDLGVRLAGTRSPATVAVDGTVLTVTTENLIADTSDEPGPTVVVGAHLDGVAQGPGINDNGSGVAAVLETAIQVAELGGLSPQPDAPAATHRVRFAFWSGEEEGLFGSRHYVETLSDAERDATAAYLNLDMLGSPNPVPFVYGGPIRGGWPDGSEAIEAMLTDFLRAEGVEPETVGFRASDHAPFMDAGIPVGGLHSGSSETKSDAQAEEYGGTADEVLDACYHQACDRVDDIDAEILGLLADAVAHATLTLARA